MASLPVSMADAARNDAEMSLADARAAPPNALTDLVGSRERRLLLIGIQRVLDKQTTSLSASTASPPTSPPPDSSPSPSSSSSSKPSPDETARKLLGCLRSLAERTRHARRQQGLLGLIFTETQKQAKLRDGIVEQEEDEDDDLPPLTPRALEESKLRANFWSPLRSSCWQRRELAELPKHRARGGLQEAGRAVPVTSRSSFVSSKSRARDSFATPATSRALAPVSSPTTRKNLPGFRQQHSASSPALTIPAPHRSLLTLDEAIDLAKETGVWPGQQLSPQFAGLAGLELPHQPQHSQQQQQQQQHQQQQQQQQHQQLGASPGSRPWARPGTPTRPASLPGLNVRAEAPDLTTVDGLLRSFSSWPQKPARETPRVNSRGEVLPSPTELFPGLTRRSPFAARRLVFDGEDMGTDKVVTTEYRAKTPERVAPRLLEFDPLLAALYAEQHPPTPRELEKHPHDRHAPPWVCTGKTTQHIGAGSIFKVIGAGKTAQVEAGALVLRERGNYVWLASCADSKAPPRAPRAILKALGQEEDKAEKGSKASKAPCHIDLGKNGLTDTTLEALAKSLPHLGPLEALSLSWSKLSAPCLGSFLRNPSLHRYGTLLRKLDLSGNQCLAGPPLQDLSDLLESGSIGLLEELDISFIEIPSQYWTPLLQSIRNQARIKVLGLAHTQLAFWRQDPAADIAILVGENQLHSLDLSGNYFLREGYLALGSALKETTKLTHLNLSNCVGDGMSSGVQKALIPLVSSLPKGDQPAPGQEGADPEASPPPVKKKGRAKPQLPQPPYAPVLLFCEGLRWNRSLVSVNLSSCALDYTADFVLAQALEHHPTLETLDLSGNPHGAAGLAAILRAAVSGTSKLTKIDINDIRTTTIRPPAREYRFDDPSDDYELNLGHPQHRALLRRLLLREEPGRKVTDAFSDISFSGLPPRFRLEECAKVDDFGVPQVPTQGTINFTYGAAWPSTPRSNSGGAMAKAEDWIWHGRVPLSLARCAVLTTGCFSTCLTDVQRSVFCEAFSEAFVLKAAHVALFARISPPAMGARIVQTLLPAVKDSPNDRPMGLLGLRNKVAIYKKRDEAKLRRDVSSLSLLNLHNPNGSYRLDLEKQCDRAVAVRLQVLSCYESEMQERWAREAGKVAVDVSQNFDFETARNVLHEGHDILVGDDETLCFSEVPLPTVGVMTLDYATRAPPVPATAAKTSPEVVESLCSLLSSASRLPGPEVIQALRPLAHRLVLGVEDLKKLAQAVRTLEKSRSKARAKSGRGVGVGGLEDGSLVVSLLTMLWPRCCERRQLSTRQLVHNPALITHAEVDELRKKLGVCAILDWQHVGDPSTNQFSSGGSASSSVNNNSNNKNNDNSTNNKNNDNNSNNNNNTATTNNSSDDVNRQADESPQSRGSLRSRNNSKSSVCSNSNNNSNSDNINNTSSSSIGSNSFEDSSPRDSSNRMNNKIVLRDGCSFLLDLGRHDERQAALYLFELSQREPLAADSERKSRIEQICLDEEELDFSKKNSFETWLLELPKAGKLRLSYRLDEGEDFRSASHRNTLAEKMLGVW